MKTKKFQKKLSISRSTVADLNNLDMKKAKGGATNTCDCSEEPPICPTESECGPYICPSAQPYSTCYPTCSSIDPQCVWPVKTDLFC